MPTAAHLRRNSGWRETFIEKLRESGNVRLACREAGVARTAPYKIRKRSKRFAAAWDDALEEACDALEAEARRRAVEGVEIPVYFQGEVVGHLTKHSDQLLIFLLKAHRPEKFHESMKIEAAAGGLAAKVYVEFPMDDI